MIADGGKVVLEERWSYPGWVVVAAGAIALAFGPSTLALLSFGVFMGPIEREFGWSRSTVALAPAVATYALVLVAPLQGLLLDRFGVRRVALPSALLFGLALGAISLIPPVAWIYVGAWALLPVIGLGLFPATYLKAVSGWFSHRLGLAIGITNAGVAVGAIIVPSLASAIIASQGWRAAYLWLAAIALLVTLPALVFGIREAPSTPDEPTRTSEPRRPMLEVMRSSAFVGLAIVFLLVGLSGTGLVVHQVPMLMDQGFSAAQAALVQSVFGAFGLAGRLLTGLLLDRYPAHRIMALFIFGGAVACGLYAIGVNAPVAFLCAALLGLLFGAEFDVLAYMIKARWGLNGFGRTYGAIYALFQLGAGFGATALSLARERLGGYSAGLAIFALCLAVAGLLMLIFARRPVPKAEIATAE